MAKQLKHQKADGIKARQDIDEMLDNRLRVADPRKLTGTLAETQRDLANELENSTDAEYLQRINVLKHANMDFATPFRPRRGRRRCSCSNRASWWAAPTRTRRPTRCR